MFSNAIGPRGKAEFHSTIVVVDTVRPLVQSYQSSHIDVHPFSRYYRRMELCSVRWHLVCHPSENWLAITSLLPHGPNRPPSRLSDG